MPDCTRFVWAVSAALLACDLTAATAVAAEFRDLAGVRIFPVELQAVTPPKPLPAPVPPIQEGVVVGEGLSKSMFVSSPDNSEYGVDWSYRSLIRPYIAYGLVGTHPGSEPLTVSSLTASDTWELSAENWRYIAGGGTDLTLGSYSPRTQVWGGGARLGGIAISRSLTDSIAPEKQLQYGLAMGALNHTDAGATSGALAYGSGASDAVMRYGVSSDFTLESQVQWAPDMVTAGIGGMYATSFGAWRASVAKATRDLHDGWRYRIGYNVGLFEDVKFSWLTEQRSAGFSDLSNYTGFAGDDGRTRNLVSTSVDLGRWGTLRGSYEHVASRVEPLKQQFMVNQQFWYSPNLRVSFSAQREQVSGEYGLGLELSLPIQ